MKNYFTRCQLDIGEGSGICKKGKNVVIDLEKPINLESDEEDEVICLSDSPELRNRKQYRIGRFSDGFSDTSLHDDLNSRASVQFGLGMCFVLHFLLNESNNEKGCRHMDYNSSCIKPYTGIGNHPRSMILASIEKLELFVYSSDVYHGLMVISLESFSIVLV
jgi:hypothetical protein